MKLPRLNIICLLVCLFLVSTTATAQFVDYGNDPARLKWNVVRTPHYKLLYPRGADSMARRYATLFENSIAANPKTKGGMRLSNYPVVLHTHNMLSNGMVSWAPRRMELITTPSADMMYQSLDKHLVLHEGRHVAQMNKLMQGPFKALYYVAGEQVAGLAAAFVPRWYLEGDAVTAETALSLSGRGRLPEFSMHYKALLFSGEFHSFDKWFLGSDKNYIPSYYALGYNLTAYARYEYGADIWDKVLDRYSKRIYAMPPFSKALKHYTGLTPKQLYSRSFVYRINEWRDEIKSSSDTNMINNYLSPLNKFYTSYQYPQAVNDGVVIALKKGLADINALVELNGQKEKHLTYLGSINSPIHLRGNMVYWTEYVSGKGWTHENYSVLKAFDIQTKQTKILTPRERYLSPAIDPKGERVILSEFATDGTNTLVLLDLSNGNELNRFAVPYNAFVKEMTMGEHGELVALLISDEGLSILQLDINSGEWTGLSRPVNYNITSPVLANGKLYYESGYNGVNNIYTLDTLSLQHSRLTSALFGAFTPSPKGDKLYYADYQASGYRIASVPLDSLKAKPIDQSTPHKFMLAEKISEQESFNMDTVKMTLVDFNPKPYKRGLNLFKIHSWSPFYFDVDKAVNFDFDDFTTIVRPGVSLLSQNELNTAITQVAWYYKDQRHHGKLLFTYQGWFPKFRLNFDYGGEAFNIHRVSVGEPAEEKLYVDYNRTQVELDADVYVPINLSRNHYVHTITPLVSYHLSNDRFQQKIDGNYRNYQYLLSELRYYRYRKMAQRDIFPRWGYQLRLQHLFNPTDDVNFGSLSAARVTTYSPGFIRNQGLMLQAGYQYQKIEGGQFYFPEKLLKEARGYYSHRATQHQWALKADYGFYLFSPDWAIGSLAYIKNVRANVFFDLTRNKVYAGTKWDRNLSYGLDLLFDWNALRLNYPLSFGLRTIRTVDASSNYSVEALFSIRFQ